MTNQDLRDRYDFTPMELKLAVVLSESPGVIFSRSELLVSVWNVHPDAAPKIQTRSVDMTIKRVRRKIGSSFTIKSVRGFGYRWEEN
jgi:DNA-binding response OmpR family regulator